MVQCVLEARITKYTDTRQTMARVAWIDHRKRQGETIGPPQSNHMQQLLLRAYREGVNVIREEF